MIEITAMDQIMMMDFFYEKRIAFLDVGIFSVQPTLSKIMSVTLPH